jgi:hypothetical protein
LLIDTGKPSEVAMQSSSGNLTMHWVKNLDTIDVFYRPHGAYHDGDPNCVQFASGGDPLPVGAQYLSSAYATLINSVIKEDFIQFGRSAIIKENPLATAATPVGYCRFLFRPQRGK